MRKINLLLPFAVLLLTLNSCKTLQIEKPKESYLPSNLAPAMSELPLQVELDVKKLEASINKKMNGLIFDGSNLGNKDVTVKVWKAQNFTFSINNNVIEYRVPLKLLINIRNLGSLPSLLLWLRLPLLLQLCFHILHIETPTLVSFHRCKKLLGQ